MLKRLITTAILTWAFISTSAFSNPIEVRVGGYLFPPFVQMNGQDASGLTLDLIDLFNEQQSEFNFTFSSTSPKRRYSDFNRGLYDVLFFENTQWGWQDYNLQESQVFLSGGEVFFTYNTQNKTQEYFNNIEDKRIIAILGYHYNFLNNETDSKVLKKRYDIKLVNSPKTVLNQVINDKADMGITSYSYLREQTKLNPLLMKELLINNTFDQIYEHRILMRHGHPLSVQKINQLLNKIQSNGTLPNLLAKYGLNQSN
jgi:ABC-type amino acid transport substrate-binding protein